MNRSSASLFVLLLPLTVACGPGAGSDPADGGGQPDAGPGADADAGAPGLGFRPTNLPAAIDFSHVGDLVFDANKCGNSINLNDQGGTTCDGPGTGVYDSFVVTQVDGSKLRVFVARNIRIAEGIDVTAEGTQPVALVALDTIEILGTLDGSSGRAGGFNQPNGDQADGKGPGGGLYDNGTLKGGGGAYCGAGGASGNGAAKGGKAYGNAALSPLVGGSTGGGAYPGAGGGAIQLVAGNKIHVGANGWVSVGGGGGQTGGGGAGGALLLEAPTVAIDGALAANGGGGGAGGGAIYGEDAKPSATQAKGGVGTGGDGSGGNGGAGSLLDGADGTPGDAQLLTHGNGGAGVGRIRINTTTGKAIISGVVSPSAGTSCGTQGILIAL